MTTWTAEELTLIGAEDELGIASQRSDGSIRPYVTIWFALSGDDLYVRSAYGYDNPWFQRALRSGEGRIRVAGMERDVTFETPGAEVSDVVSEAYHAKYVRYGPGNVGTVATPEAVRSTLRVVPC